MTVADPTKFILTVTVTAAQRQRLTDLASQHKFATVEEFLIAFAMGEKSTAVFAPPEPTAPPSGLVDSGFIADLEPETAPKKKEKA